MSRRTADRVLLVVLVAAWAVVYARGIGEGLRTQRGFIDLRVSSAPADGYPVVLTSLGSPPFQPRDLLLAVEGEDLRGSSAIHFYDRATRAARENGLTTIRAERDGAEFTASVGLTPLEGWWLASVTQAIVAGVAIGLFLRAPEWHLARTMFVTLWCWLVWQGTMDTLLVGPARGTTGQVWLATAARVAFSALAIWTAQEFTLSARPVPRAWRALALAGGLATIGHALIMAFVPHSGPQRIGVVAVVNTVVVFAVMAGLGRAYLRADPLERRQIRWVVLGYCVALVGVAMANVLSFSDWHMFIRVLGALAPLGLPAGILISVVGYRWLDIDRVVSATASCAIVGIAVLGAILALVPRVTSAAAPALGLEPAFAQWLLTLALVIAAVPAALYLRPRLDRRMFAERHARMSGFARLLDEIEHCSGAEELWKLSSDRIGELLEPRSVAVYAREGERFVPRFARGGEACSPYEADSVLVRALDRRGRPLAADSGELDPFDRAALETLGVSLIVPVRAGERLLAFACLGSKRSGDIYTQEEKSQLGAVAARCGELLLGTGESSRASAQIFRREGDLWTIASRGKQVHLRDMRGLHYLATLLREPGREFAALDLVRTTSGLAPGERSRPDPETPVVRRLGDAGPVLDAQARGEYRARLAELEAELADAERCADLGRRERASEEREALLAELQASGRGARPGSDAERARIAVTKAIKVALEMIAERHPELGEHLAATVRRGYVCAYEPDPRLAPVEWEV